MVCLQVNSYAWSEGRAYRRFNRISFNILLVLTEYFSIWTDGELSSTEELMVSLESQSI